MIIPGESSTARPSGRCVEPSRAIRGTPVWPNAEPASNTNATKFRMLLLSKKLSSNHIERMIDQRCDALQEVRRVGQSGVSLKGFFAGPT
jgi:hypothetical protein